MRPSTEERSMALRLLLAPAWAEEDAAAAAAEEDAAPVAAAMLGEVPRSETARRWAGPVMSEPDMPQSCRL
jgi:hypothetical protein